MNIFTEEQEIQKTDFEKRSSEWYKDKSKHTMILSNDIDSLASCSLLHEMNGWEIGYFFDFNNMYRSENNGEIWSYADTVGVDIALIKGKCLDNHVTSISSYDSYNGNSINPNITYMITAEKYGKKYIGSTLLMLWSLFHRELPQSEKGKMMLLCVDAAYAGYYKYDGAFRSQLMNYLNKFDLMGLEDVLEKHTIEDFEKIIRDNPILHTDISIEKTRIFLNQECQDSLNTFCFETGLQVMLPNMRFYKVMEYFIENGCSKYICMKSQTKIKNIFSFALTYKNAYRCSVMRLYKRKEQEESKKEGTWETW